MSGLETCEITSMCCFPILFHSVHLLFVFPLSSPVPILKVSIIGLNLILLEEHVYASIFPAVHHLAQLGCVCMALLCALIIKIVLLFCWLPSSAWSLSHLKLLFFFYHGSQSVKFMEEFLSGIHSPARPRCGEKCEVSVHWGKVQGIIKLIQMKALLCRTKFQCKNIHGEISEWKLHFIHIYKDRGPCGHCIWLITANI